MKKAAHFANAQCKHFDFSQCKQRGHACRQAGIIHPYPLIMLAGLGLLIYFLVAQTFPFKDQLFSLLYPKPSSQAQMTHDSNCEFSTQTTGGNFTPNSSIMPAFCDTFTTPSPGGRGGELDERKWEFSRITQGVNSGQGMHNYVPTTHAVRCKNIVSGVIPYADSFFCGIEVPESEHWMESMRDDGGYNTYAARIRQPFDFSGRTGTFTMDVDAQTDGPHGWWTEAWLTDEPINGAHGEAFPANGAYSRNGLGIKFSADWCGSELKNAVYRIYTSNNYNLNQTVPETIGGCFPTGNDLFNRIQIRVSQTKVEIWVSDASTDHITFTNFRKIAEENINLQFTRGFWQVQHVQYNASKFHSSNKLDIPGVPVDERTYHWDNIGFDGPQSPTPRAYEFPESLLKDGTSGINLGYLVNASGIGAEGNSYPSLSVQNVDLTGATNAILTTSVWYEGGKNLQYRFNGGIWRTAPFPWPDQLWAWRQLAIPVQLSDLRQGTNSLELKTSGENVNIANMTLNIEPGDMLGGMPGPSMTPIPTPTPQPTPTPTPAPSPVVTPTPVPTPPTQTGNKISYLGQNWNISGVNVPWYNWACDFGCGSSGGGVSDPAVNSALDAKFAQLKNTGAHTVRWWVFPGDPWQITRDSSGPTGLNSAIYADFDAALSLAQKYDLYYNFVLFNAATAPPRGWIDNSTQRAKLAQVLGTLFARYKNNSRVMSWEIYNEPEFQIWNNEISETSVVATGKAIADSVHANSSALVTVGHAFADAMPMWLNANLDYHSPHWYDYMNGGDYCLRCNDYNYYKNKFGITKPLVVGEFYTSTGADALQRFNDFYNKGYAGAWAWSLFPERTDDKLATDLTALTNFVSSHTDIGPKTGVIPTPPPPTPPPPTPTPTPRPTPTPTPAPTPGPTPTPPPGIGSAIKVYAAGTSAKGLYPTLRLQIKNSSNKWVTVKEWKDIRGDANNRSFVELSYTHPSKVLSKDTRVRYVNDFYDRLNPNEDRNLRVDRINIDNINYQSESPTTYSVGSWDSVNGCKAGFKSSEWLHCNGYFEYR